MFQRVSIKCELSALSEIEVADYIRHRLSVAGGSPTRVSFDVSGAHEIYRYSGGVPRLINLIADRSLLAGMSLGVTTIDNDVAHRAIDNLQLRKAGASDGWWNRLKEMVAIKKAAVVVGVSILVAIVVVALITGVGAN